MAGPKVSYLVFDVETAVDGRLLQRIKYPDQPELPPAEAIARWRGELREKSDGRSDFIAAPFHLPVALAVAKVGEDFRLLEAVTLDRPQCRPPVITRHFWSGWQKYDRPTLVTFNGRRFDLPVLEQAAFRYGIDAHPWFTIDGPNYRQPRYRFNYQSHLDLLDFLTNAGAYVLEGGLNLLATLLSKPGKMEVRGDMVQELWERGERERVDDYCLCDVLDTYFVFLRLQLIAGRLTLEREHELVAQAREWIQAAAAERPALDEYLAQFSFWQPTGDDDDPFLRVP